MGTTRGTSNRVVAASGGGTPPSAPSSVTSITKDAGATVSFLAPASSGSSSITQWVITPYIGASAQSTTTVNVGSAGSITGSNGSNYVQCNVTGLTNSTAYTFSVHAVNGSGAGTESAQSGANTPLAGLVFGDDFNGSAGGAIDPEWYILNRCGFIAQSEIQWYLPSQTQLDGSGNLALTAVHTSHTGTSYPSDGNTTRTQTWLSGAVQSNTRTFQPSAGNTMTFEVRQQVCADAGTGFWPGLFWLEGQNFLTQWKTDPAQPGWDTGSSAEIDVAEWNNSGTPAGYGNNTLGTVWDTFTFNSGIDLSAAMHVYQAKWKPSTSTTFFRDGTQTHQATGSSSVATTACSYFLLIYLQMLTGGPTTTESCLIDYVRVFDLP